MVSGLTTHYFATHHSLLATHYSPLTTYYSPLTTHHSLFPTQYIFAAAWGTWPRASRMAAEAAFAISRASLSKVHS